MTETKDSPECGQCGWKCIEPHAPQTCPNCGHSFASLNQLESETGGALVRAYFSDVWEIISRPKSFFKRMPLSGGISGPLAFALVTHWLGSALSFLWHASLSETVNSILNPFFQIAGDVGELDHPGFGTQLAGMRDGFLHWFWGTGSVIADPFITVFSVLFTSFWVFIGARILIAPGKSGAPREIAFESAVRLVCYGMTPSILAGIPLVGWGLASLLSFVVTAIGAKEVYRTSTGRAVVIALFPKLLLLGLILTGILVFAVAIVQFMSAFF